MGIKPPKVSSHCDRLIEILVKYMVESLHSCLAVGAPTAAGARPGGGAGQPGHGDRDARVPDAGHADRYAGWYLTSAWNEVSSLMPLPRRER